MIKKEKVIQRIESQIAVCKSIDSDWISITVETGKRILELLNGQPNQNRCDECKYYYNGHCLCDDTIYWDRDPDWHCGDWEKRIDDVVR